MDIVTKKGDYTRIGVRIPKELADKTKKWRTENNVALSDTFVAWFISLLINNRKIKPVPVNFEKRDELFQVAISKQYKEFMKEYCKRNDMSLTQFVVKFLYEVVGEV